MPHHSSSSAADTVAETSKKIKKRKCKPPIETFFEDLPRKRLSKEEKKYIEESLVCSDLEELPPARRRGLGPLNVIDVFDAKGLIDDPPEHYCGLSPVRNLKKDPSLLRSLTKSATLAIANFNSIKKTNYRFVNIEMAVWQLVNGVLYHITFLARNAEKKLETFEATVFTDRWMRKVRRIGMKSSDVWYVGTHNELLD